MCFLVIFRRRKEKQRERERARKKCQLPTHNLIFIFFKNVLVKPLLMFFPPTLTFFPVNFQLRSARDGTSFALLLLRHLVASWNLGTSFPCLCRHRTFLLETDTSICRRDWIDFVLSSFKPKGEIYTASAALWQHRHDSASLITWHQRDPFKLCHPYSLGTHGGHETERRV